MADDFDIDKFLSDSFAVIEKKFTKANKQPQTKKVNKILDKIKTSTNNNNDNEETQQIKSQVMAAPPKINISDYNFEKVIDNRIYQEIGFKDNKNQPFSKKIELDNLLKPLFPNDKVYKNEFKNSDKAFLLDKYIGTSKKKDEEYTKSSTNLKINKFKKLKESEIISQLKNDNTLTFNQVYPIHKLWKEYISTLLNKTTQAETIYNKMLKSDLHGAIIEVVESKNKNMIGLKGINLLETRRSFNIINEEDQVKTILKKGSVFKIDLPYEDSKYSVKIMGDNFTYKAVERTKAKFKNKYNL